MERYKEHLTDEYTGRAARNRLRQKQREEELTFWGSLVAFSGFFIFIASFAAILP